MNDLPYEILENQWIIYRKYCPCYSCAYSEYNKHLTIQKAIHNTFDEDLIDDIINMMRMNIINNQNARRNTTIDNIISKKYES